MIDERGGVGYEGPPFGIAKYRDLLS